MYNNLAGSLSQYYQLVFQSEDTSQYHRINQQNTNKFRLHFHNRYTKLRQKPRLLVTEHLSNIVCGGMLVSQGVRHIKTGEPKVQVLGTLGTISGAYMIIRISWDEQSQIPQPILITTAGALIFAEKYG